MYLVLFLTCSDCSIEVFFFFFLHVCINTVYVYRHIIAEELGACYVFLYQLVRANCSGVFSFIYINTQWMEVNYSIYCFQNYDG